MPSELAHIYFQPFRISQRTQRYVENDGDNQDQAGPFRNSVIDKIPYDILKKRPQEIVGGNADYRPAERLFIDWKYAVGKYGLTAVHICLSAFAPLHPLPNTYFCCTL